MHKGGGRCSAGRRGAIDAGTVTAQRLPRRWTPPIADRQAGLFTPRQALAAGASPAQIRRRRSTGAWVTVVGDALTLADTELSPWHRIQAAGLTWPDAVVCFGAAAALHGLPVSAGTTVDMIVPRHRRSRGGLIAHELRLDAPDVVRRGLASVTSLQRTLFDCIGRLPEAEAESLVTWAATRGRLDVDALERAVDHRPGWWGSTRRRQALADLRRGTLSAAERRLHRILRHAGIAGWEFDQPVHQDGMIIARVDVLFRVERLVLEIDGFGYHGRSTFQNDRARQNGLVSAGYTVLRFTWEDLTQRPDQVAIQVTTVLTRLRPTPPPSFRTHLSV